jgi:rhamnosyl/mannosyltransferase
MQYLWDHPHTAQAMGQRAEQRYWRYFTGERMVAQYVGLYRELLQQRGAVPSS